MKEINRPALVKILGFAAAGAMAVGCSSSNSSGSGGSTGSGGSHVSGAGGTSSTGSGGTSTTGAGGSTSTGTGGTSTIGCAASDTPPSATIADFMGDGGLEIMGGITTYSGIAAPTYSITGGALSITDTVAEGALAQYLGVGIYFNGNAAGTDCIDASAYTGVQFDISGSLTGVGCSVQYSTNDSEHADSTNPMDKKASGPAGSYAPQLAISTLTSSATTMMVPFADASLAVGSPATPIDTSKLEGVQWQLTVPPAAGDGGAGQCVLSLTIDNVEFYK